MRESAKPNTLIESFSCADNSKLAYSGVGRSPADRPFLCAAVSRWSTGRERVVLGADILAHPLLVVDGDGSESYDVAIKNACSQFSNNTYLTKLSSITIERLLRELRD